MAQPHKNSSQPTRRVQCALIYDDQVGLAVTVEVGDNELVTHLQVGGDREALELR